MTTMTDPLPAPENPGWFYRAEAWLDDKGKGAWIATMVLGFVFFWPVGLAVLAYMIWSKRMFSKSCRRSGRGHRNAWSNEREWQRSAMKAAAPSGNSAFDQYKADTLARLEHEQSEFENFLERLRDAKDKAEFDQFMDERAHRAPDPSDDDQPDQAA
ncbi:DUF2852 domain-containing protein [Falsiphaeobacter marinintestinus]|uniref:DUF2852 domain-containing protein n=1 Tax=Falsiphaeobacter marinintestinus TaxID=1492905 RepID=UPI0011B3EAF2|nr:DUF2852 domain-containing protein [Phaeobacter marinintestinus]